MSKRDGGPAFPTGEYVRIGDREHSEAKGGMTLRDYYAARAIDAMVHMGSHKDGSWDPVGVAHYAYEIADAMLAERDR